MVAKAGETLPVVGVDHFEHFDTFKSHIQRSRRIKISVIFLHFCTVAATSFAQLCGDQLGQLGGPLGFARNYRKKLASLHATLAAAVQEQ